VNILDKRFRYVGFVTALCFTHYLCSLKHFRIIGGVMADQTINASIGWFTSLIKSPKEWLIMQDDVPYLEKDDKLTLIEVDSSNDPTGRQAYGYVDLINSGMFFSNNASQNMYHFMIVNTAPWIDYSSTTTVVGWASFTTKVIRYCVVGNIVFVQFYNWRRSFGKKFY